MITYLDRVLVLYPTIQHIMYWNTQKDGTPWLDPYDGLIWENIEITKPTKEELDLVTDQQVLDYQEALRIQARDLLAKKSLSVISNFNIYKQTNPDATFSEYLDILEELQNSV